MMCATCSLPEVGNTNYDGKPVPPYCEYHRPDEIEDLAAENAKLRAELDDLQALRNTWAENAKLRALLRRVVDFAECEWQSQGMLKDLIDDIVAEALGDE